jgi:hypothetical protein
MSDPHTLFDFADPRAVAAWSPIDDRVMGGVSWSRLRADSAGHAVFEGVVSLERHGGFASIRSAPAARGRAGAVACAVELRGQGATSRRFRLKLLTDNAFDGLVYQAGFEPEPGAWHTLRLPLANFRATFRGREVAVVPPLDPAHIRQLGLMTAGRQAGPFALELRRIALE